MEQRIERLLISVALFSLLSYVGVWAGMTWGFWSGVFLWFVCASVAGSFRLSPAWGSPGREDSSAQFLFWVFCVLGGLLYLFLYQDTGAFMTVGTPNNNGDWPFHMNQIKALAQTRHLWPDNPILAGEPLRYPFGINWFSAMGLRLGIPMHLMVLGMGLASLGAVAYLLRRWGGSWALVAFFCSGGGWAVSLMQASSLWQPTDALSWKNLWLAVVLPQRGLLFALPAGLLLLRELWQRWESPSVMPWRRSFLLIWAVLPWFHLHSFVFISLLTLLVIAKEGSWGPWIRSPWAWGLALVFCLRLLSADNVGQGVRWSVGWFPEQQNVLQSFLHNWGPWPFVVAAVLIFSRGTRASWGLILAALFVLFHFLMLAPWNWDQIKILLWVYLALSLWVAEQLRGRVRPWLAALLIFAIHAPGAVQFFSGLPSRTAPTVLWSMHDQKSVQSLMKLIPAESTVLIAPEAHHPFWAQGGWAVAGYLGHLWAHGVNTEDMKSRLDGLFRGNASGTLQTSKRGPSHLLWGPLERKFFAHEKPEDFGWTMLHKEGSYALYLRP